MLTGQEKISELIKRYPQAQKVLYRFGMTEEAEQHFNYKNLAHAAIVQKIPLQKILDELSKATGEDIQKVKVSGIIQPQKAGSHRSGMPTGVKNVLAVHSGKGGVGKTFVAINLAAALATKGLKIGLLDADVDCPNVMKVLKLKGNLIANKQKKIVPLEKFGLKVVSMAPMLQQEEEVLLWRGPIVSRVLEQFLYDVDWSDLDYLIVDLPPGTSDIPLTLLNLVKETKLLVVTTPQSLAILDAKKSINMAKKMNIQVVGVIENMAGTIFGQGKAAKEIPEVPMVASIELKPEYAQQEQAGEPLVLKDKTLANVFEGIF